MSRYSVIVKGNTDDLISKAKYYGLKIVEGIASEVIARRPFEVHAVVESDSDHVLYRWFAVDSEMPEGGFPFGSLLFFSPVIGDNNE